MSRLLPLALVAMVAACQPFYRDKLRAGRRSSNTEVNDRLLAEAATAEAAGDLPRAVALAREAIHENPTHAKSFAMLAIYLRRASAAEAAEAVVRFASTQAMNLSYELASAFVADDLIADALDADGTRSLESASSFVYREEFAELLASSAADASVEVALAHYLRWLDGYGIPDHRLLREAAAHITQRVDLEIQRGTPLGLRLLAAGPLADQARVAGDLRRALTLYSLAFRVRSPERFLPLRGAMARAAAQVTDPSQIDPVAYGLAVDGNGFVETGRLGPAIHAYRRAVARAPWWGAAHANLADLLVLARRPEEAKLERAWAEGLVAGAGWALEPDEPTTTDLDADTVVDPTDRCPFEVEDVDGFEDSDGCPDIDNDRDVVPDAADKCRDIAEDRDGFEDEDGCADPDNDHDGIADTSDACALEPEVVNGTKDGDGCPDEGRVVLAATSLTLRDPIAFDQKTARLARASSKILDALVATLAGNPRLRVEIGVHGSIRGKPELDAALTQARAEAIRAYLVDHGVAAARLTAVGYGDTRPLEPGTGAGTLAKNRRVELTLLPP